MNFLFEWERLLQNREQTVVINWSAISREMRETYTTSSHHVQWDGIKGGAATKRKIGNKQSSLHGDGKEHRKSFESLPFQPGNLS